MNSMRIVVVERSELADVLRGVGGSRAAATEMFDGRSTEALRAGEVGVGFCDGRGSGLPDFVVIPGEERREFFAWVNTYCPFAMPLSQWCRVVTQRELVDAQAARLRPEYGGAIAAWAGAVIGEAILHMKTGGKLGLLSVAALHTCTTFVAARSFGLWGSRDARLRATERFRKARGIVGGTQRDLGAWHYERAWDVLEGLSGGETEAGSAGCGKRIWWCRRAWMYRERALWARQQSER